MGRTWVMELPPVVVDPLFLCELALELGMPVGEIGARMSAHELCVVWPAFFAYRRRQAEREAEAREQRQRAFGGR
jgi:hypothetical protein